MTSEEYERISRFVRYGYPITAVYLCVMVTIIVVLLLLDA